jgi:hypothetical protein
MSRRERAANVAFAILLGIAGAELLARWLS